MTTIRALARRPGAFQCLAASPAAPFVRHLHSVPTLANHHELQKNGIPKLLSKKAFQIAYTDYQGHIVNELNTVTSGLKDWGNKETKSLVIEWARDPMRAYAFNVASMAFNNHFFFRGINTNPHVQSAPSADLVPLINENFTSLDTLRETFLATAEAMFGPGFVWLVQSNDTVKRPLKILTTYIAGSPLSDAHYRRQSEDLNTHSAASYQQLNSAGAFGSAANQKQRPKKALGGVDVVPLLCVNTWEHVWLHDYGVAGKTKYLNAWWDKIDWEQVRQTVEVPASAQSQSLGQRKWAY